MKTATPILSELQNEEFAKKASLQVAGVDLYFQGNKTQDITIPFVQTGPDAMRNKVLLWLHSINGDYVRESTKGGVLYNLLGRSMNEDSAAKIKASIATFFSANFAEDLSLVDVAVTADKQNRRWIVQLYVRDVLRRETFDVSVGVSL